MTHISQYIVREISWIHNTTKTRDLLSYISQYMHREVPRICNIIKTRDLLSYISQYMHREVPRIHDTIKTRDPFRYISQYIRRRSLEFTINTGDPTDGVSWRWDILQIQHMHTWICTYTKTRDPMIGIFRNIPTTRPLVFAIPRKQETPRKKGPSNSQHHKNKRSHDWHIFAIYPPRGPSHLQHHENKRPLERGGPSNSQYIGTYPHDMHHISKIYTPRKQETPRKKRSLEFTTSQKQEVPWLAYFRHIPTTRPLAFATSWKQETSPRKRRSLEFAIYRSHLHDTPQPNEMHPNTPKKRGPLIGIFSSYTHHEASRIRNTWTHPVRPKVIRKVSYIAKTIGVTFGIDFVPRNEITSTPPLLQMATTFPQRPRYLPLSCPLMNTKAPTHLLLFPAE